MEPVKIEMDQSNELFRDLMPKKFGIQGKLWVGFLLIVIVIGAFSYYHQLKYGLVVTDMRDFTSWGIYISNFVFFVAISLVGSLVSAILKLSNVEWRTPLVRISEVIAVAAITFASIIIIVDMGRPERFWHLFAYGRIQSPIIWDVIVISTYFVISVLLLYIPLLPDIAICRDTLPNSSKWKKRFYTILALNWRGTNKQFAIIHKCINILAVLVIPLALGIHTVTSWLFATTYRAGWDSSNFGPYFVAGAFQAGCAAVIAVMYVLRNHYRLQKYITQMHFDNMAKLLVLLSLIYLYFNINEYLVPGYKMETVEGEHLHALFSGPYAPLFWSVQIFGMILPIIILLFKKGRRPVPALIAAIFVVVGAWFKRFLIVVPTLLHPFVPIQGVPESWHHYVPTFDEWAITSASLAGALLVITLLVRIFPIIPIWEMAEEKKKNKSVGRTKHNCMNRDLTGLTKGISLLFFLVLLIFTKSLFAQDSTESGQAKITISFAEKDSVRQVTANLTNANAAVKDVDIHFYVKKSFGLLPLEADNATTDENGEASVDFPTDLPGDASGNITVVARVEDDEKLGNVEATKTINWGIPAKADQSVPARALWSSGNNAPWPLTITVTSLVAIVWGIIFYMFYQLVAIKKAGKYEIEKDI